MTLILGTILSFSILQETKDTQPEILEKSLRHILNSLKTMNPSILRAECIDFTNGLEVQIDTQRDFLVSLVEDTEISSSIRELALAVIVVFGNLRMSGEDYLVAFNLLKKHDINPDVYNEVCHNSILSSDTSTDGQDNLLFNEGHNKELTVKYDLLEDESIKITNIIFGEDLVYVQKIDKSVTIFGNKESSVLPTLMKKIKEEDDEPSHLEFIWDSILTKYNYDSDSKPFIFHSPNISVDGVASSEIIEEQ